MRNKIFDGTFALKLVILITAIIAAMYGVLHTVKTSYGFALLIIPLLLAFATSCYLPFMRKHWTVSEQLSKISISWYLLPSATTVSFIVALEAHARNNGYWPLFVAWSISILAVLLWSLFAYLAPEQKKWQNLKRALYAYRMEIFFVIGIMLLAFLIRFIKLTILPTPFDGDESLAALPPRLGIGFSQNMFSAGGDGAHPMMNYLALVPFHRLFEAQFAQRLPFVLITTLTLPILYLFLRQAWDKLTAMAGTIYLAGYHFYVHYSRQGILNVAAVVPAILSVFFCWRVLERSRRSDFILLGLSLGSVFYFWQGARVMLIIVPIVLGVICLGRLSFVKKNIGNFILMALAFLIIALPMMYYWTTFPQGFNARFGQVGIFNPTWLAEQKSMGRTNWDIAINQLEESFSLFVTHGDNSPHYRSQIALVDKFSLAFFLIGFFISLIYFRKTKNLLLILLFIATVVLGGTLTVAPYSARLVTAIPAIACWVSIGIVSVCRFIRLDGKKLLLAVLACVSLLVAYNLFFYFHTYAQSDVYADYNTRTAYELSLHMRQFPPGTVLFLYGAPNLFTGHAPFQLFLNEYAKYDVFLNGSVVPSPSNLSSPRVFAFLPDRENELLGVQTACPGGVSNTVKNSFGKELFISYEFANESTCLPVKS